MSDHIILDLTTAEILGIYNRMSKIEVKKFKDRKTAEARIHGLAIADNQKFLKAMKAEKVRTELITKYEAELKAESEAAEHASKKVDKVKEAASKKADQEEELANKKANEAKLEAEKKVKEAEASKPSSDDPWSQAVSPLLKAQAEETAKLKEKAGPEAAAKKPKEKKSRQPKVLLPGSRAAAILWHAQLTIEQSRNAKEDEVTTSTELARRAKTSTNEVIKQLDLLRDLKYVEIEDDSTGDGEQFYYVTLTKTGLKFETPTPTEYPSQKAEKALPGAKSGPKASSKAGKVISKLVKTNPRREGTHGWNSFNIIKTGMTYEEYIDLGGRANDLQWDIDHKWVELK
jgi:hypothetical protein